MAWYRRIALLLSMATVSTILLIGSACAFSPPLVVSTATRMVPRDVIAISTSGSRFGRTRPSFRQSRHLHRSLDNNSQSDDGRNLRHNAAEEERRSFLRRTAGSLVLGIAGAASAAPPLVARAEPVESAAAVNFDGLLDLPPVAPGRVRMYLCRHGQTENNRLHLVQGARVDPFLNDCGREQARRAGMALARLTSSSTTPRAEIPGVVVHSRMNRARETAEVLRSTAVKSSSSPLEMVGEIPSLGEVDFGMLEGKEAGEVRVAMTGTFGAWATGGIDKRPPGGEGDSGREVLERSAEALRALADMAKSSGSSSVLAVTHSTALRVLLATVSEEPLVQAALWKVQNGSVNVVDVDVTGKTRKVTISSKLFTGGLGASSEEERSFELVIPEAQVIRMNEARHLQGMDCAT